MGSVGVLSGVESVDVVWGDRGTESGCFHGDFQHGLAW